MKKHTSDTPSLSIPTCLGHPGIRNFKTSSVPKSGRNRKHVDVYSNKTRHILEQHHPSNDKAAQY